MNKLPKIHFILPGGGVRGAFQAGFLYTLCKNYSGNLRRHGKILIMLMICLIIGLIHRLLVIFQVPIMGIIIVDYFQMLNLPE